MTDDAERRADRADITQTRVDVAEIKGMLSTVITSHDSRIVGLEKFKETTDQRLNDKGKLLARHDERLNDLEDDKSSRQAKIFGILGAATAVSALLFAIFNRLTLGT